MTIYRTRLGRVALFTLCTWIAAISLPASAAFAHHHHPMDKTRQVKPTTSSQLITTAIILHVSNLKALQTFVAATLKPTNPHYHHFLTVGQFRARFAPSPYQIRKLVHYLQSYGITVDKIYADHLDLTVTGTAAALNAAFATQIRDYEDMHTGRHFHRPAWKFALPGALNTLVLAVPGLSNEPGDFHPMIVRLGHGVYSKITPPATQWPKNGTATGVPQDYTVGDVANFYNVDPLYRAGIKGRHETIGIMTLANFQTADAYAYWKDIGLKTRPNRIRKVPVDGGTPVAANVGDDETSLDVEQSGGLAPDAKIRVYIAPNTNNGFLDLFYTAVSENVADTVSISWGEPEEFYFPALNNGVDLTGQLRAMHQALLEGAAQGQSFFAAAGDAGAYDVNRFAPIPYYSKQLSVDSPADDPYITAAGGTTVATTIPGIPQLGCPSIVIPTDQVWGWDYLNQDWATCLGLGPDALFPEGGGGGVSSFWRIPYYQRGISGMQRTLSGSDVSLIYYPNYPSSAGAQDLIELPADFPGRNLPDLSLNADPETGYIVTDCTDFPAPENPSCATTGFGGTSFVAPQLNGITALIDETAGGRVGLLNPFIYALEREAYDGPQTPFYDIVAGDNWFYSGIAGYDDGAGIGSVNATRLALIYLFRNAQRFGFYGHTNDQ